MLVIGKHRGKRGVCGLAFSDARRPICGGAHQRMSEAQQPVINIDQPERCRGA
jgi:hypothetical protein